MHVSAPEFEYVPTPQGAGAVEPSAHAYPAGQSTHVVASAAHVDGYASPQSSGPGLTVALFPEKVPAGQLVAAVDAA